jgi:Fe-S cluster assembly protein SufD
VLERPIVLVGWLDGSDAAVFPRLVVRVGEGAAATVVDHLGSTADCAALVAPVVELVVEPSARLGYTCVQDLGPHVWHIGSQISEIEAQATLVSGVAALGGDYARQRFDCHLVGRGATGQLRAVYHGDGDQTLDFRTFQRHIAADTTSDLLFKGAVDDRARSVYTGLIHVHPEARGTNAFQTNRNIMLSRESWAESVPNLEIENNDVRCSHASTVGPIDADQRFYLESRGVPPRAAERLVVGGFFDEVIDTLPAPQAGAWLRARIGEVLDRRGTNDG